MRSIWLMALSVIACSEAPATSSSDVTEAATIVFDGEFGERVDGRLVEGGELRIEYAPERLAECEGWQGGRPVWAITGYYQLDDAEPEMFAVLDPNHPEDYVPVVPLDAPGELSIWFEATNIWGCHTWDSDYGHNYRFDVHAAE